MKEEGGLRGNERYGLQGCREAGGKRVKNYTELRAVSMGGDDMRGGTRAKKKKCSIIRKGYLVTHVDWGENGGLRK